MQNLIVSTDSPISIRFDPNFVPVYTVNTTYFSDEQTWIEFSAMVLESLHSLGFDFHNYCELLLQDPTLSAFVSDTVDTCEKKDIHSGVKVVYLSNNYKQVCAEIYLTKATRYFVKHVEEGVTTTYECSWFAVFNEDLWLFNGSYCWYVKNFEHENPEIKFLYLD